MSRDAETAGSLAYAAALHRESGGHFDVTLEGPDAADRPAGQGVACLGIDAQGGFHGVSPEELSAI